MITIEPTEDDFAKAYILHWRWGIKTWVFLFIASAFFLGIGLWIVLSIRALTILGAISIACTPYLWLYFIWLKFRVFPKAARKRFRKEKAMQRPYTLSWDDDGLRTESSTGYNTTPWSDFYKWRKNLDFFLVYTGARFRVIPKRAFTDPNDALEFEGILLRKIGQPC